MGEDDLEKIAQEVLESDQDIGSGLPAEDDDEINLNGSITFVQP